MKILIVVANFVPEIGSASHVYFDLARAFVRAGSEVDVLTSYPRDFNLSHSDLGKIFPTEEIIDGIRIHRCKHPSIRDNLVLRGLEHFLLPNFYFRAYYGLKAHFDVILIYIPPLPLYYLAKMIKAYDGTPSVLNFQDFHPQELTDVGLLKNRPIIEFMRHIERAAYEGADYITVLSEGGIDYVLKRGKLVDPHKISHIYNGGVASNFDVYLNKRDFKKKNGLNGRFLVTYAGILSPMQGIDNILDAAKELSVHRDINFYIVGDGMMKDHLEHRVRKENISNVRLLPLQPREEYFDIINSSDISIVSLDNRMKAPCLPGKLINLMAFKQPIIAIVSEDSETANVIRDSRAGIVVAPDDNNALKKAILDMKGNPSVLKQYGENGRRFFQNNMDIDKNVEKYKCIFNEIVR